MPADRISWLNADSIRVSHTHYFCIIMVGSRLLYCVSRARSASATTRISVASFVVGCERICKERHENASVAKRIWCVISNLRSFVGHRAGIRKMLTPSSPCSHFCRQISITVSALENGNPPAAQRAALICSQIESVPWCWILMSPHAQLQARGGHPNAPILIYLLRKIFNQVYSSPLYIYTPLANRILFLINLPLIKFLTQIFSAAGWN